MPRSCRDAAPGMCRPAALTSPSPSRTRRRPRARGDPPPTSESPGRSGQGLSDHAKISDELRPVGLTVPRAQHRRGVRGDADEVRLVVAAHLTTEVLRPALEPSSTLPDPERRSVQRLAGGAAEEEYAGGAHQLELGDQPW